MCIEKAYFNRLGLFVTGSADSGIADQAEMSPEMRVLQEVMDTEGVYVADLEEVIEVSHILGD